jgi:hypothetical protein
MRLLLLLALSSIAYCAQLERITLPGMNEVIGTYDDVSGILTIVTGSGELRAPYRKDRIVSREPITEADAGQAFAKRDAAAAEALERHAAIPAMEVAKATPVDPTPGTPFIPQDKTVGWNRHLNAAGERAENQKQADAATANWNKYHREHPQAPEGPYTINQQTKIYGK